MSIPADLTSRSPAAMTTMAATAGAPPARRAAVALVDAVHTGGPFVPAAESLGFCPVPVYSLDASIIATMEPSPPSRGPAELPVHARSARTALAEIAERDVLVHAVVAAAEPGVVIADQMAAGLGLPHNPLEAAAARRDKIAMRVRGTARQVPQPLYRVATGKRALADVVAGFGMPVMVKAPAGAGSHNIFLIRGPADLRRVEEASDVDLFGRPIVNWLVEEYVRGDEFAVNTFSVGGSHRLLDVWRKRLPTAADYDQPYWNAHQVEVGSGSLERFCFQVLDAFGVEIGPCHIEVKVGPRGPVLIELGARLPGAHIAEAWRAFGQVDPFADTILARLGQRPRIADSGLGLELLLGLVFIANDGPLGVLREITGLAEAARQPGVASVRLHRRVGDLVPRTTDLETMLVTVTVAAGTQCELLAMQDRIRALIRPLVEP